MFFRSQNKRAQNYSEGRSKDQNLSPFLATLTEFKKQKIHSENVSNVLYLYGITPREIKNAIIITGHFGFVCRKNSVRKITALPLRH